MKILMMISMLLSTGVILSLSAISAPPVPTPTPAEATEVYYRKALADYVTDEELTAYFEQFDDCHLPCLWGIRLGQTDIAEIRRLLLPLHVPVEYTTNSDGSRGLWFDTYDVSFDAQSDATRPQSDMPDSLRLSSVYPSAHPGWKRYNVQSILRELGTPQEIYLHFAASLDVNEPWGVFVDLYYPKLLLIADFQFAIQRGEEPCLAQTPVGAFKLFIHDPAVPLQPYVLSIDWRLDDEFSVENKLHMTPEELAAILLDPDQCVKVSL